METKTVETGTEIRAQLRKWDADRTDTAVILHSGGTNVVATADLHAKLKALVRGGYSISSVIVGENIAFEGWLEKIREELQAERELDQARRDRAEYDRLKAIFEPCPDT